MTPTPIRLTAPSLRRLGVLLVLFAALRRVRGPIAIAATAGPPCQAAATAGRPCQAAEGLRHSIEVVVRLADLVGIDPPCTDRPRSIPADRTVLPIVLAAAVLRTVQASFQYVLGLIDSDDPAASASLPMSVAENAVLALPTAIQVIALPRRPDT
jgi:hypothetical protein